MVVRRSRKNGLSVRYLPKGLEIIQRAKETLQTNPLFRGHLDSIELEYVEGHLVLLGRLPSFYLRKMLNESLSTVPGMGRIENRIDVISSDGLSSLRTEGPQKEIGNE